jgi:acetyl esterase/lipase
MQWSLDAGRLAVGGDSSGANLAAAAALRWRDRGDPPLAFQLLVYPALDRNYHTASYNRFGDGGLSLLSRADVMCVLRLTRSSMKESTSLTV